MQHPPQFMVGNYPVQQVIIPQSGVLQDQSGSQQPRAQRPPMRMQVVNVPSLVCFAFCFCVCFYLTLDRIIILKKKQKT